MTPGGGDATDGSTRGTIPDVLALSVGTETALAPPAVASTDGSETAEPAVSKVSTFFP